MDIEAYILSLLLTEFAPYGDMYGCPATSKSNFVSDLEISGDDFYEFIEALEIDLGVKFSNQDFSEICYLVPSEAEVMSLLWWRHAERDVSVADLSKFIETKIQKLSVSKFS